LNPSLLLLLLLLLELELKDMLTKTLSSASSKTICSECLWSGNDQFMITTNSS
jgi:hypothetical protein